MTPRCAVVHLVWPPAGPEPFERFMASYEAHEAGLDHDLVLLHNGVPDPAATAPFRARAARHGAHEVRLPAPGQDLPAYLAAARALPHDRLCFLNSYSEVLAGGWLAHLSGALDAPGTGLAGATGSWGSHRSFAVSLLRVLPHGYGDALGDRAAMAPAFRSVSKGAALPRWRQLLKAAVDIPREIAGHPGFPAPHIRTNAFVIERERLLGLAAGRIRTKSAAYRFEGGRRGMTGQVLAGGLGVRAVGRDGVAHAPDDWPDAELFWQGTQRDLLVSDNQTRAYSEGDAAVREALSRYAWGPRARWA